MIWHQIIQADKLTSNINTFSSQADKLLVLLVSEWSWEGVASAFRKPNLQSSAQPGQQGHQSDNEVGSH